MVDMMTRKTIERLRDIFSGKLESVEAAQPEDYACSSRRTPSRSRSPGVSVERILSVVCVATKARRKVYV